ncbi:SelB C-terminal domain-containing protein [Streptomyces anthocyanicus]|uniref:SelB domain-containing protein n=1 Tax=Streptomyces anthocyanicus TaxID=68174 RepID=UPI002F907418|nr:SelB C-terminal domain-containing protein [Streptomyces anthocyanicus]
MHVVATAGHVDHGKSTLVRALTGMEPDRWAEEKRRGMTIDLGFAWTTLSTGETVTFVDVPGHHRFVPNMLAGVGPVPAVMLVIAADDGWNRQTQEHVEALSAFGVRDGLLVVTRADLGDGNLAVEEARDRLAHTPLAALEAVVTSAPTGVGLSELRGALGHLTARLPSPAPTPRTRLWVDRVFTVRGAGTVVTGTLGRGGLGRDDELLLWSRGERVRVRQVQSLGQNVERTDAVARVAVNLRGTPRDGIRRGDALVAPGWWAGTREFDARVDWLADCRASHLILHVGSAAVPVRIRRLGEGTARIRAERDMPLDVGERALLRDPGQQRIVAGLVILDLEPPPLTRRGAAARRHADLAARPDLPDAAAEIARRGAVRRTALTRSGQLAPDAPPPRGTLGFAEWCVDAHWWRERTARLAEAVRARAAARPDTPALPHETALRASGLVDGALLSTAADELGFVQDRAGVREASTRTERIGRVEVALDTVCTRLRADPFDAPGRPELDALGLTPFHLRGAANRGRLCRLDRSIYVHPEAVPLALARLAQLPQPFTLSAGRQVLGTSRRVAVPLFELLDRLGHTKATENGLRHVVPRDAEAPG